VQPVELLPVRVDVLVGDVVRVAVVVLLAVGLAVAVAVGEVVVVGVGEAVVAAVVGEVYAAAATVPVEQLLDDEVDFDALARAVVNWLSAWSSAVCASLTAAAASVSSTFASVCPAVTVLPARTETLSTVPWTAKERLRVCAGCTVPVVATSVVTAPRSTATVVAAFGFSVAPAVSACTTPYTISASTTTAAASQIQRRRPASASPMVGKCCGRSSPWARSHLGVRSERGRFTQRAHSRS
jgi:hypothetical protein